MQPIDSEWFKVLGWLWWSTIASMCACLVLIKVWPQIKKLWKDRYCLVHGHNFYLDVRQPLVFSELYICVFCDKTEIRPRDSKNMKIEFFDAKTGKYKRTVEL